MSLSYNEFVSILSKVTRATSVTSQKYYDIHIIDNLICGKRGGGTSFQIKLAKLYNAYIDLPIINTTTLKPYVGGVQSPALAILVEANLVKTPASDDFVLNDRAKGEIIRPTGDNEKSTNGKSKSNNKKFYLIVLLCVALGLVIKFSGRPSLEAKGDMEELIPNKEYVIQHNTIATYDKEDNELLTQYSVDQNDMGVTQMLLDGRAKMRPAGRRAKFIKIIRGNAVVCIEGEAFNMIIPTSALKPQ